MCNHSLYTSKFNRQVAFQPSFIGKSNKFLNYPPQLGKKLLNIGHINHFFKKEVTTKRDTKEGKEAFKSQFNVSNSKKRALSSIQNNKARFIYICVC